MRRPMVRARSASSHTMTKMRATISRGAPAAALSTSATEVLTSSALSQLRMAPSASRPARCSMPGRSAAR